MANATRIKKASVKHPVPQSRESANAEIYFIGEAQRARQVIQKEMNDRLAAIKAEFEEHAKEYTESIKARSEAVQIWAEANRESLTSHGKVKTVKLGNGEIKWRTTPPKVSVRGAADVIDHMIKAGLERFVRTKREVNKDAILNDAEAVSHIKGIHVSQSEDFVIIPFETDLEEVR